MRAFIFALIFVLPLYWIWLFEFVFEIDIPLLLNSFFALLSLYIFLSIPPSSRFSFGFFVGLFWFYWVGFSFFYFGFAYLIPLISILVACIYMFIFALALQFSSLLYRGIWLLVLGYIHPFGFDWMKIESFFAYSYFGVSQADFFLLILGLILFKLASKGYKGFYILSLVFLCFGLDFKPHSSQALPFKFDLLHTNFSQNLKWQRDNTQKNTEFQVNLILQSIQKGNKLIITPETAFPFVLERTHYFALFKQLSYQATLVIGSMQAKDSRLYNSTYVFQEGEVKIFDKVILAPFGEKIPLPDFLAKPLHKIFLGDHSPQFSASSNFGSFIFEGERIKSVICYEGTSELSYQDFPRYLIVISNNAWFPHTIEAALQKNLMKYYARLYKTTILHSSNGSPSFVIFP